VLGDGLTLIGLGTDPCATLSSEQKQRWEAAGGRLLQIGPQGQRSHSTTPFIEDLGLQLTTAMPLGSLLVVRPDRILMHDGAADQTARIISDCLHLLRK